MDVVLGTQGSELAFWMSRKWRLSYKGQQDILLLYFNTHQLKNPQ